MSSGARTAPLIRRAYRILGEILRDGSVVEEVLWTAMEAGPSTTTSLLMVAAGMLGADAAREAAGVQLQAVQAGFGGERELSAAALAIALADPGASAERVAEATDPLRTGTYVEAVCRIRMRAERGMVLSVG